MKGLGPRQSNFVAKPDPVREYWEDRAHLGFTAGGPDVILKRLEMRSLIDLAADGMRVLDAGCGNGVTALAMAEAKRVEVVGIDYSRAMIDAAKEGRKSLNTQAQRVSFRVADVTHPPPDLGTFDYIYTERCLINLPDWPTQRQAALGLAGLVNPGGILAFCEASQDGLNLINAFRGALGLEAITPPFHNRYIPDAEMQSLCIQLGNGTVGQITGTYYFVSRVINAAMAKAEGRQVAYEDPINLLALKLPPVGNLSQAKLWIWRRLAWGA